ncbi:hypothetical protein VVD49_19545 [Uliginosibacterium sp. H3]|uniref:Uncharacterized protein n=1 Tax=Uliginosibacterium silvisoli TaxID=3114758 RepID=A0ABU6K8V5_9RHOO|nr:hypothetical protein [Uliginosibacterium sp. H3]
MKTLSLYLLALLFLSGCAIGPTEAEREAIKPVRSAKIAVNYSLAAKRINYTETLYRVLWLETKTSSQDFSGIWSPDQEITTHVTTTLRKQNFGADSVYEVVSPSVIEAANRRTTRDVTNNASGAHPQIAGTKLIPYEAFFKKAPTSAEFLALAEDLKKKNYRYFLELTAMDLYGTAIGYGMVTVAANPHARVIDLQTNEVIWSQQLSHQELYQLGGDLKKLEENSMSKTKEGVGAGIGRWDFMSLWNFK